MRFFLKPGFIASALGLLAVGAMTFPFWKYLKGAGGFTPHGYCLLWNPGLIWLHVASDALIFLSYLSIPFTLGYFVRRRRDLPFNWMFLCFGTFIIACGLPMQWRFGHSGTPTTGCRVWSRQLPPWPQCRRRAEEALLEMNRQLQQRNAELSAVNQELESFSYCVSHDLRAPLRAIDGFSLALLQDVREKLAPKEKEHLNRVRTATARMTQLIDDLLGFARTACSELKRELVDMSKLAEDVVAQLRAGDPERNPSVVIAPNLVVEADQQLLRVVLENLIGNAWKFTSKRCDAHIEIGIAQTSPAHVFFVRDNGPGFDMKYADRLFGAFQRLHHPSEFPGTGIGLASVQRIVHRHGGRTWAEGALGAGATFYFVLNAAQGEQVPPETAPESARKAAHAGD